MRLSKIVVVGSINNDLIINSPQAPRMGETVVGNGFMTAAGGKGANQAVAAARLGADVAMVASVGSDIFGSALKRNLEKDNIDTRFVKTCTGCATGTAVIVLHQGDNFIVLDAGANQLLTTSDIEAAEAIIKQADYLIVQLEIPVETAKYAMETAHKHGVKILLNPAPAVKVDDAMLSLADIVTPNESECEWITGIRMSHTQDAFRAAKHLMDKGVRQVCMTLGENGVVYNDGEHLKHMPCRKVETVIDTTAAGDCFAGALAVALCEAKDIDAAVMFASAAAAIAVSRKGAQPSLPHRTEVDAALGE